MNGYIAIVKKELLDALRDGKSLSTALMMPVLFALVTLGSLHFLASLGEKNNDITLPIKNADHIVPLVEFLQENGVEISSAPEQPENAVRQGEVDMVLIVPDTFNENFREQKLATLDLLSDHSDTESQSKANRIKNLIRYWSLHTGSLRLIARNVSPGIANPIAINDINVTSDQRLAFRVLSGLPMFFLLIAFASGLGMTADVAAGERERRTLEPLLITPVSYSTIIWGKWSSTVVVTMMITLAGSAMQFIAVNFAPLADLNIRLELGASKYLCIIGLLLPIIFLAAGVQLLVSFFAKSFKDAQAYASLLVMLPIIPGMYLTFNSSTAETWQMFVPLLGSTALIMNALSGEAITFVHVLISSLTAITCAIAAIYATTGLLKMEKTVFS